MISSRGEPESKKIVTFYIIYTTLHFPIVLLATHYSGGFYRVGKYSSQFVLIIIAFAEMMKYFVSVVYLNKSDFNLTRRHENVTLMSYMGSLFSRSKLKEGIKIIFTVIAMTIVYFTISVLYGAELFIKNEETLMFSSLLSVLTIFPICINLGSHFVISLLTGFRPTDKLEYLLFQNVYLTCIGAWLGAFVIPLDWDRPWQEWPIPCSIGAMFGFQLSHILMVFYNTIPPLRKKIKF